MVCAVARWPSLPGSGWSGGPDRWPPEPVLLRGQQLRDRQQDELVVRRRADLVTQAQGGRGAVRESCDMLLMSKGMYQELLEKYTRAPY